MIVQIKFSEFSKPNDDITAQSDAVIINAAVDHIMNNMFPEFNESDIITENCSLICDRVSETVYIEIAPMWLNGTIH